MFVRNIGQRDEVLANVVHGCLFTGYIDHTLHEVKQSRRERERERERGVNVYTIVHPKGYILKVFTKFCLLGILYSFSSSFFGGGGGGGICVC